MISYSLSKQTTKKNGKAGNTYYNVQFRVPTADGKKKNIHKSTHVRADEKNAFAKANKIARQIVAEYEGVKMTKITILEYPTDEDWIAVKQRALVTVGLKAKTPPTKEWKYSILKARHSPIRRLRFSVLFEDIPNWVAVHLVRHVHSQPYVKSQRNDRQSDYDRNKAPQNTPVNMIWDFNGEELMNIANKRLCKQAAKETREIIKDMCDKIIELDNIWTDFLVPMCKYVGECKEMFPCYLKENKNEET